MSELILEATNQDPSLWQKIYNKGLVVAGVACGAILIACASGGDGDPERPPTALEQNVADRLKEPGVTEEQIRLGNLALHRSATIQFRDPVANQNPGSTNTELCNGTHIGNGMILTAGHCLIPEKTPLKDGVQDVTGLVPARTVYRYTDERTPTQKVGQSDRIIVDGVAGEYNSSKGSAAKDLAIVHVPGAETLPSMPVSNDKVADTKAKRSPGYYGNNQVSGEPIAWFVDQFPLTYEPAMSSPGVVSFVFRIDNVNDEVEVEKLRRAYRLGSSGSGIIDPLLGVVHAPLSSATDPFEGEVLRFNSKVGIGPEATADRLQPMLAAAGG